MSQPEVSRLFKGNFQEYSVERLMEFLTAFDEDMEIISKPRHGAQGRISFRPRGGLRQSSCGLARLSSCGYFPPMTKLEKIDRETESLPPQEMRAPSAWFADLRERF